MSKQTLPQKAIPQKAIPQKAIPQKSLKEKTIAEVWTEIKNICEINKPTAKLTKSDWLLISKYDKLTDEFLGRYKKKIHWIEYLTINTLSEDRIIDCIDTFNVDPKEWLPVLMNRKMSEISIEDMLSLLDDKHYYIEIFWIYVSQYQKLSDKFLNKYKDKICWQQYSRYQKMSKQFIIKHIDKLDNNSLLENKNIVLDEDVKLVLKLRA